MIKILHGSTEISKFVLFPQAKENQFYGIFCYELGLDVFMNVVDMVISFQLILVGLQFDFLNFNYN